MKGFAIFCGLFLIGLATLFMVMAATRTPTMATIRAPSPVTFDYERQLERDLRAIREHEEWLDARCGKVIVVMRGSETSYRRPRC